MNPHEQWPARLTVAVAAEIQRHRKRRGWSAQKLSDECAAGGLQMPRSTLADLENGRRAGLSVAELLVIARALDVPPLLLLFPVGREAGTEVLPGVVRPPFRAAAWFSGECPFPGEDDDDYVISIAADWNVATGNPLAIYRLHDRETAEEMTALRRAGQFDERAAAAGGDDREAFAAAAVALRQAAEGHRAARENIRRQALALGILPPGAQADDD